MVGEGGVVSVPIKALRHACVPEACDSFSSPALSPIQLWVQHLILSLVKRMDIPHSCSLSLAAVSVHHYLKNSTFTTPSQMNAFVPLGQVF